MKSPARLTAQAHDSAPAVVVPPGRHADASMDLLPKISLFRQLMEVTLSPANSVNNMRFPTTGNTETKESWRCPSPLTVFREMVELS